MDLLAGHCRAVLQQFLLEPRALATGAFSCAGSAVSWAASCSVYGTLLSTRLASILFQSPVQMHTRCALV